MRSLAYDHYCDLQIGTKGAASSRRTAHTAFLAAFSRGVILIGALSKGLRLPLLRTSGRLRHYETLGAMRVDMEHDFYDTLLLSTQQL